MSIYLVVVKIIISFVILLTGAGILLIPELFKSINLDYEINDFCQTNTNMSESNLDYLVCDNKFKKQKVILLLIDSLPFDSLKNFHNLKESKMTNFYRGEGLEYKQSGALFETILTGKFSRNYLASIPMKMDNIQKQLYNANLSIFYRVRDFPLYTLFNKSYIKKLEKHFGESLPLSTLCDIDLKPFESYKSEIINNYFDESGLYFREGKTKEILYENANKKLKNEFAKLKHNFDVCFEKRNFDSVIFYTDHLDHLIHTSHRNEPLTIYSIYFLENFIKELIDWINEKHGEYALGFASDHGGQLYFGEDTLCNHGCNSLGNEAVFSIYTKELGENFEKYKNHQKGEEVPIVSLNDFACTFMQVVKNGNLPLESTCTPRYIGNDKLLMFTTVKSKEIQLKTYLKKLIKKYPQLKNQYETKYNPKFKNKFASYFKNNDSIYQAEPIFYKEYMDYLIGIQDELFDDVVKSSHNQLYYLILYSVLILFILGFFYFVRKLILLTREKVFKEIKKIRDGRNQFLPKIVTYTYVIVAILLIEPLVALIYNNSINISDYIRISIFLKFFFVLFLVIYAKYMNKIKTNNYWFLIFNIAFIIGLNLIASIKELFSSLDKYINTQPKSDFYKIYFSYPLFVVYTFLEIYSVRKYYLSKKYKIRYIYIFIPYIIILSYFMFTYDVAVTVKNYVGNTPERIILLKRTYIMIFLLLLFIKPFIEKEQDNTKVISSEIINLKFFLFMMLNFICVELERILMIALLNIVLLYLCYMFRKEQDLFIKMIFIVLIICYPQIHFIANQGTYTMDTSIKVTIKCPSKWADDRPILMGVIFIVHKFRFDIMTVGYMFCLIRITKKKIMNYYTEFIRLINTIQLFGILICFLYFVTKEREKNYIQILYLIATHVLPIILFDLTFLFNYIFYKIINRFFNKESIDEYEILDKIEKDIDLELN